jgi:hypothetical protein
VKREVLPIRSARILRLVIPSAFAHPFGEQTRPRGEGRSSSRALHLPPWAWSAGLSSAMAGEMTGLPPELQTDLDQRGLIYNSRIRQSPMTPSMRTTGGPDVERSPHCSGRVLVCG